MEMRKALGQSPYLKRKQTLNKQDSVDGYYKPAGRLAWEVRVMVRQGAELEAAKVAVSFIHSGYKPLQAKPRPYTRFELRQDLRGECSCDVHACYSDCYHCEKGGVCSQ